MPQEMDTVGLYGRATYYGLCSPSETDSESELQSKNNGSQLVKIQAKCSGFIKILNEEDLNKCRTPNKENIIDGPHGSDTMVEDFGEVSEDEQGNSLSLLHVENKNEHQIEIFTDKKRKHKGRQSVKKLKSNDDSSVDLHSTSSSSDSFNGKSFSGNEREGEDDSNVINLTAVINLSVNERKDEDDSGSKLGEVLASSDETKRIDQNSKRESSHSHTQHSTTLICDGGTEFNKSDCALTSDDMSELNPNVPKYEPSSDETKRIDQNSKRESSHSHTQHSTTLICDGGTEFNKTDCALPSDDMSELNPNVPKYFVMEQNVRYIGELGFKVNDGMLSNNSTDTSTTENDCPGTSPVSEERGSKILKQTSVCDHTYSIQVPKTKSGLKENNGELSHEDNGLRIEDLKSVEGYTNTGSTLPTTDTRLRIKNFLSQVSIKYSKPSSDVAAAIMLGTLFEKKIEKAMSLDDVNEALIQGKPEPPNIYITTNSAKEREELSEQLNEISNMIWFTGSRHLQCYLCWHCLLFAQAVWCLPTIMQLGFILKAAEAHQSEMHHMEASLRLRFYEANIRREREAQLESKKKREILLRYLIEIVCSNGAAEERMDLLSLACTYNTELEQFVKEQPDNFLRDFVEANVTLMSAPMERFLLSEIKNEIRSVPFVSIIFEEISDGRSFVAIILRYVNNSSVATERLVKMVKIGATHSVTDFLKTINQVVQDYHLTDKLVGFTYSGSILHPKDILIVNTTINRLYPRANFFPYQQHNFRKIITQSLLHLPECRKFFSTMSELADFFKNSPNIMAQLEQIDEEAMNVNDKWDFAYDHIATIKNHYKSMMFFFDEIVSTVTWEPEIVTQVKYFEHFLGSSDCRVLVLIVSAVLNAISSLCTVMESNVDIDIWKKALDDATGNLSKLKSAGVGKLLQDNRTTLPGGTGIESSNTSQLYDQIIDTTLMVINQRCVNLDLALVGPRFIDAASKCDEGTLTGFLQRISVDHETYIKLINKIKSHFGEHLNLAESIRQIHDLEIDNPAKNILHNFLQLCLTIPSKPAHPSTPSIHRLHSYVTKNKTFKFSDLLIYMENDIFNSIKNEDKFYDYIIHSIL